MLVMDGTHMPFLDAEGNYIAQDINLWTTPRGGEGHNPSVAYNQGAKEAHGEYLILTSPEVMHEADVLAGLDEEFAKDPDAYVVCACRSLKKNGSFHMWYQHSEHRPLNYHFCTAISRENFLKIGGFDEAFGPGHCYDDDDLVMRVKNSHLNIVVRDDLVTAHQWHRRDTRPGVDYRKLEQRNKELFITKWGEDALCHD